MDIAPYIKEQIMLNECVIVRNVGGFETTYREALFDKEKKKMLPPGKKIRFHQDWIKDNGILENRLTEALGVKPETAREMIDSWANDFRSKLSADGRVEVEGLGEFMLDSSKKIQFRELETENYLADSFGLDTLELDLTSHKSGKPAKVEGTRPTYHSRIRPEKKATPKRKNTGLYIAIGSIVVLILVTSLIILSERTGISVLSILKDGDSQEKKETVVFGEQKTETKDNVVESIEKTIDEKTTARQALAPQNQSSYPNVINQYNYYIIAGSFRSQKNAELMKSQLQRKGFDPVILVMGKNIRVVIGSFDNRQEAIAELRRLRHQLDQAVWLLEQ